MKRGGKIITPIRETLQSPMYDGVIFHCGTEWDLERTRISVLMARHRNDFDIRTHKVGDKLIVYKTDVDIYDDPTYMPVDLRG